MTQDLSSWLLGRATIKLWHLGVATHQERITKPELDLPQAKLAF
jgi:hypothetical protein